MLMNRVFPSSFSSSRLYFSTFFFFLILFCLPAAALVAGGCWLAGWLAGVVSAAAASWHVLLAGSGYGYVAMARLAFGGLDPGLNTTRPVLPCLLAHGSWLMADGGWLQPVAVAVDVWK